MAALQRHGAHADDAPPRRAPAGAGEDAGARPEDGLVLGFNKNVV